MKRVNHPVRDIRRYQGLTLEGLSEKSGVSIGTISRLETRLQRAKVDTLEKLAEALGVDWVELVERPDEDEGEDDG